MGSGSASLKARFLVIRGHFFSDRHDIPEAVKTFEEAAAIYRELGLQDKVARTLFEIADTLSIPDAQGGLPDAARAFSSLEEAETLLKPGDPLAARVGLLRVELLVGSGNPQEAARRIIHCERPSRGRMLIRYRFIGARLLHALGQRAEADRLFNIVVSDDIEGELFKDALLDLLFVLKLHVLEGELAKALGVCKRALAEPVLAHFAHEQLRSVWQALLNAIEAKTLSTDTLSAIQLYMSLHWRHPSQVPPAVLR